MISEVITIISIHAPARGATKTAGMSANEYMQFQSTLPRGERQYSDDGKTFTGKDFNPRSREGSDEGMAIMSDIKSKFQSTLPRGERHNVNLVSNMAFDFNPRSREGSDYAKKEVANLRKLFQSTLPRGERQQNCTHSQYFFRELCESCQNLQITLTNYSFFYLIICFLQSFSSANQLVFSCSLIIRTN